MICEDFIADKIIRQEVTKICYVLDDMAGDPVISPKPQGFKKNTLRKQYELVSNFHWRTNPQQRN